MNDVRHSQMPGADIPDRQGRTGLHRTGLDLHGNADVVVRSVELLSADWYVLRATTFDIRGRDGTWRTERRETYDRGNGATILLYDTTRRTVLLTRQFRYPVYVNGHRDGMLLETAAGLLDQDAPEAAIRREATEETGLTVGEVEHLFDVYMSPGSVTELLHFYAAPYRSPDLQGRHHGVPGEGEDIETVELHIDNAISGIGSTIVDAKTIMLLQWAVLSGPFATTGPPQSSRAMRLDDRQAPAQEPPQPSAFTASLDVSTPGRRTVNPETAPHERTRT